MNSSVRIIKREINEGLKDSQSTPREKTVPQGVHEIESTVKGWITEFRQRKRTGKSPGIATVKVRGR